MEREGGVKRCGSEGIDVLGWFGGLEIALCMFVCLLGLGMSRRFGALPCG